MIKFRRRHARVIIHELSLHPRVYCTSKSMDATFGNTRIRGVHTPTRIHDHPNRVQLRMRRPKNILISIKKQSSRIEVVLRVLRVPDFILQSRLGQLHGLFILFGRLDELGVDVCGDHGQAPRRAAHRHRGVAPEGLLSARCSPRSGGCSSARGCPSTQGTTSPGDVRSRATTRRPGHLVSTREARRLPLWARLGSASVTRLLV